MHKMLRIFNTIRLLSSANRENAATLAVSVAPQNSVAFTKILQHSKEAQHAIPRPT